MADSKALACPICQNPVAKDGNGWFPFCSNRCKLVDLSKWLGGEYRVPAQEVDEGDGTPGADDPASRLH